MLVVWQFHKIFASNIGIHRYFAHKSFQTGPVRHKLLAYWTVLLAAKSPITYAMNHRHHHKYADQANDTHNPNTNFFSTLFGFWEFNDYQYFKDKGVSNNVRDLMRDPTLVFIERNYYTIWFWLTVVTLLVNWKITLFLIYLPAGYFHIGAGMFNTIGHFVLPGSYRNFDTNDLSQNHWLWSIITYGEGFHNNHHYNQTSYDNQVKWYEFDITAWIIRHFFAKTV